MKTIPAHTFVICAYQESEYLEACVQSVLRQSVPSALLISTSTPNDKILSVAKQYGIPLHVNEGEKGIAQDWNFGYLQARTELITIAHQDDIYEPLYTEIVLKKHAKHKNAQLFYTDYYELRNGEKVFHNKLLVIKRILNFPLQFHILARFRFIRRRVLSLGCSICCPSVTFVKDNVPAPAFDTQYKNSCDYVTWEMLSRRQGAFMYIPKPLVGHRIYQGSATTRNILDHSRSREDQEILLRFWPKPIARLLFRIYGTAQKSNEVQ